MVQYIVKEVVNVVVILVVRVGVDAVRVDVEPRSPSDAIIGIIVAD